MRPLGVGGTPNAGHQRLHDGDTIVIGPVTLRLRDPEDRYLTELGRMAEDRAAPVDATRPLSCPAVPRRTPLAATATRVLPAAPAPSRASGISMLVAALALLAVGLAAAALILAAA